jgi:hypothetical protein
MPIPMEVPARFLADVVSGAVVRYGCILKDADSGRIVGHLKEVGQGAVLLSRLPLPSLGTAVQVGQWLDTHSQLQHIRHTLSALQLVSTVGAVASVAGLGVSVAGFAVVLNRLDRLESRLNEAMGALRAEVERLHLKLDLLAAAKLRSAWERLDGAARTDRPERGDEGLKQADGVFQEYRHFYHCLITELRPAARPQLSFAQVRELYGRFFACALAELEANFLLHDFAQWRHRHEAIVRQLDDACVADARDLLRCRVDALGLVSQPELVELQQEAAWTHVACRESADRVRTAVEEVRWVEEHGLSPAAYLRALRDAPDEGVVLLRHHG